MFHKVGSGGRSIPYDDAVCEALCFGWIDSLVKRLDDTRYQRKFTPRKPTSKWSDLNRDRWARMKAEGRLTPAGEANAPTGNRYEPVPEIKGTPAYIRKAFRSNPKAWKFFQSLSEGQRKYFVLWIHTAKRPETREKRIRESLELLAAGKKLGLK